MTKEEIFQKVWDDNFVVRVLYKQFKNPNPEEIARQNGMDLEDVVSSCWLRIWEKLDKFDPDRGIKPETYIWHIVINQMKTIMHGHYLIRYPYHNRLRYKKETTVLSLNYEYDNNGYTLQSTIEAEEAGDMEVSLGLKIALDTLNDQERYVLSELIYKERASDKVGKDLKVSGSTIRNIRDRAYKKLREELA